MKPNLKTPPPRPAPERVARLRALAQWHDEWVGRHLDGSGFTPRGEGSDYNLHHLDVDGASPEAEDEFHARAAEIMFAGGGLTGAARRTKPAADMDWRAWNVEHPDHPRGPDGQFGDAPGLAGLTVPKLRDLARERGVVVPSKARKAEIVALLERPENQPTPPPRTRFESDEPNPADRSGADPKAVRAAARERARLIAKGEGTARLLAEVDELLGKGASDKAIGERLDERLLGPEQRFANADPTVLTSLRRAHATGDRAKLRAAATRAGKKVGVVPVGRAGERVGFDPVSHEPFGDVTPAVGERVEVVRRGSRLTLPDGEVVDLDRARVVAPPARTGGRPEVEATRVREDEDPIAADIEAAYRKLVAQNAAERRRRIGPIAGAGYVSVAEIRQELGDRYPREQVDAALDRMIERPEVRLQESLIPLGSDIESAGVTIGGQQRHVLRIEQPGAVAALASLRDLPDSEAVRDELDLRRIDGPAGLKALLVEAGLPRSGRKRDLVDRLVAHVDTQPETARRRVAFHLDEMARLIDRPSAPTPAGASSPRDPVDTRNASRLRAIANGLRAGTLSDADASAELREMAKDYPRSSSGDNLDGWANTLDRLVAHVKPAPAPEAKPARTGLGRLFSDEEWAIHGRGLDPTLAVTVRQVQLSAARTVAEALAEVDELLDNETNARVLRNRIESRSLRVRGTPAALRDRLLAAVDADDDGRELRAVLDRVAREAGLTPVGAAGDVARFDRSAHDRIDSGTGIRDGDPVAIVRQGYRWDRPGEGQVAVLRPIVEEITEAEYEQGRGESARTEADFDAPLGDEPKPARPKTPPAAAAAGPAYDVPLAQRDTALREMAQQPVARVEPLGGGVSAERVERVVLTDGRSYVRKAYNFAGQVTSELLAPRVLEAVGVRTPAVVRLDDNTIAMEWVAGRQGGESGVLKAPSSVTSSRDGRLLGLADALMGIRDRGGGNWMRTPDGHIVAIDNGPALSAIGDRAAAGNPFTSYLMGRHEESPWKRQFELPEGVDLQALRKRLQALRPQFEDAGRKHTFRWMMERFDEIEKRAVRPRPTGGRGVTAARRRRGGRGGEDLERYWTEGEGLALWATNPHPWATLRDLLLEKPEIAAKPGFAERLASTYFKLVFGYWPGHRKGRDPHGPG